MPLKWFSLTGFTKSAYFLFSHIHDTCYHCELEVVTVWLMRFRFLMVASMKMAVFWDIVLGCTVEIDQCSKSPNCFHHRPDDGGV
jgi:hypothetical protein